MHKAVFLMILVGSFPAIAGVKLVAESRAVYTLVDSGKQVDALEATQASIAGKKVLKCEEVEATASHSGSISLKKKK